VGFLSRPLGGFIFGHIGDRYGRKIAFITSMFAMSAPSIIIGFLPSYAQIGILAPILLGLLRVVQGIPAGGELPGVMCYLFECASEQNQKFMASFTFLGVGIGVMISISEYFFLQHVLSADELLRSGWRVSFIFGGLLGLLGFYLRSKLHETPRFSHLRIEGKVLHKPVLFSLHKYKKKIILSFFCCILATVGFFIISVFPSLYLGDDSPALESTRLKVVFALVCISTVTLPLFGKLGDKFPQKKLLYISAISVLIISPALYFILLQKSILFLFAAELLLILFLNVQFALLPSLMVEIFPTAIRYSGVGLSFNLCDSIIGGVTPLLCLYLFNITGNAASFVILLCVAAILSLGALFLVKEHNY
jgi:MHS family proline/betaine transporter-like MFS transporter